MHIPGNALQTGDSGNALFRYVFPRFMWKAGKKSELLIA